MKNSDKMIISFILKAVITTIISVLLLSAVAAEIFYKFDLSTDYNNILSIIICVITSFLVTYISVSKFKNSGALLGFISQIPLIFYSLINLIFGDNTLIIFIIKLVMSIIIGGLIGSLKVKRNSAFKV